MYDYPLPSSSSSNPPSPIRKHVHRRSQSPLPHLATLLPASSGHHHHHHHHQYSPSTRAADISRLLDPAYASSSSSSTVSATTPSPHTQTRAYVDHNGDLHDPDYRDFPVLRPTTRSSSHAGKTRRTSTGSANAVRSRSHDRYSLGVQPTRPGWERDWGAEAYDSDVEDVDDDTESQSHFSPFASQHASSRKNTSHNTFSFANYQPPSYYFTDALPTSSPVGSLEEEHSNALGLRDSPFDEDEVEEIAEESRPRSSCLIRKSSRPKKGPPKDEKADATSQTLSPFDDADEHAVTPTCTHILRQQWEVITLRIRFGLFHAKRRLRRRRT
ncbi:hypothetical protein BC628DRAFT_1411601 [Trametes gibbosa]|nr:hypothetical protein BC628DRAFT_1411601 [Trametes gibbosa]